MQTNESKYRLLFNWKFRLISCRAASNCHAEAASGWPPSSTAVGAAAARATRS